MTHIPNDLAPLTADRRVKTRMSDEWYIENLRLSFLGVTNWTQRQIFSEIAGVGPTQINAQPPMQMHQETGNVADAYLAVTQQGSRIDLILSDQPTRNTVDRTLPGYKPLYWIGPFPQSLHLFDAIAAKSVSLVSGATRVAYAMTLVRQTQTVRETNITLQKYLPTVEFDPNNDLDLVFQINHPIRDQRGRFINRLAKWESIQVTSVLVAVGNVPAAPPLPSGPPICVARISVDVNTDPNNTSPFTGPELSELVTELRDYATNIAQNGDSK
jgi:hypothetical protein